MNKYENALDVFSRIEVNIPVIDGQILEAKGFYPAEYELLEEAIKKAKAFDIIRSKCVDMEAVIKAKTIKQYNFENPPYGWYFDEKYNQSLTQEEYDLLKEVLK